MSIRDLLRNRISPITVRPGDSIELLYEDEHGNKAVVANQVFTDSYTFTEALVFEADAGEFGEGRAIGGVFIE